MEWLDEDAREKKNYYAAVVKLFSRFACFACLSSQLVVSFSLQKKAALWWRMASVVYRRNEKLQLYRALLRAVHRYPLKSRREVVGTEVKAAFRNPQNDNLTNDEIDYKLILGWERSRAISKYAENMHWFHSRDEVTREMLMFSRERDEARAQEVKRCNEVGDATKKNEDVTKFRSVLFHFHPDYYNKIDKTPLHSAQDLWRSRGPYGSDIGGPRQKFFVKRYQPIFPQGW